MLLGHLARMDESADARRILTAVPQSDWKRPEGRPFTSWLATVKNDLSCQNLSVADATKLALDRPLPLWRLLAASRATHWNGASWTMMMMMIEIYLCGWLIDWLIDWLIHSFIPSFIHFSRLTDCLHDWAIIPYRCVMSVINYHCCKLRAW